MPRKSLGLTAAGVAAVLAMLSAAARDRHLLVAVALAALGLLDQRGRRLEALAVLVGQLAGAGDEARGRATGVLGRTR